jgi:hypothetical protein
MDIGDWLRTIGLQKYEAAFRENKIDSEVLSNLTVEDLKELGVATVGERRKLLAAIAALAAGSSVAPKVDAAQSASASVTSSAERRQLTVDAVEKVENRTTPKISQMVIFGLPRRCDAL